MFAAFDILHFGVKYFLPFPLIAVTPDLSIDPTFVQLPTWQDDAMRGQDDAMRDKMMQWGDNMMQWGDKMMQWGAVVPYSHRQEHLLANYLWYNVYIHGKCTHMIIQYELKEMSFSYSIVFFKHSRSWSDILCKIWLIRKNFTLL